MTHLTDWKPLYRTGDDIRDEIEEGGCIKPYDMATKQPPVKTKHKKNAQNHKNVAYSVKFKDSGNPSGHAVAWFYGKRFPLWKRVLIKLIGGEIVDGKYYTKSVKEHQPKKRKQCGFRWEENEF